MNTLPLTRDDVVRITQEIWGSMLSLDIMPVESAWLEDGVGVVGCVQIVGAWEGAIRLDLSPVLATKAAAAFTGLQPAEVTPDEIRDAAGELANITAGSIKILLPVPCHLSLPVATDGTDYKVRIKGSRRLLQMAFDHSGEKLLVTVLEKAESHGHVGWTSAIVTRIQ
jgi:chemotaxis protein CheX